MTSAAVAVQDPLLESDFMLEMLRQMRAVDALGVYDAWPSARILEPFILTPEKKRAIPLVGDPDAPTLIRITAFYNAIAALIEKECGRMAVPLVHITSEGFGRALITVGKLVVLDRTLRDVHRFGFASLSKMKDDADTLLAVALEIVGQHSAVAGM